MQKSVIKSMEKCREALEDAMTSTNEFCWEDVMDEQKRLRKEQGQQVMNNIRKKQPKQYEEQKSVELKLLSTSEYKKIFENIDKINQLLGLVNPNYQDQKYLQFENNERSKRQNSAKNLQLWEQVKISQKERYSKFNNDFQDVQVPPDYEYNLHYQQGHLKKAIQIKAHDLLKLNPPNYLNDSIINFYLKLIETEIVPEKKNVYIFNTYILERLCPYDKLAQIGEQKLLEQVKASYDTIKRWVKEDIFEKDYLLFPLNIPEHWSILIFYKPALAFNNQEGSCIIYLDSFGLMDLKLISMIKMYIHKIYMERNQLDIHFNDSPLKGIPSYQLLVPRQVNYFDCGVFLLEYAESFLNNPEYVLDGVHTIEGQDKLRLFPRTLISKKRALMKQLLVLLPLSKEQAIANYKQQRQQIIDESANDDNEFDTIDQDLFKEFLNQKNIINPSPEQYKAQIVEFYMNPAQNYYHIDPINSSTNI